MPTATDPITVRLAALERAVAALAEGVTTRRLSVVDAVGTERLVAQVRAGTAELRLVVGTDEGPGGAAVVLHAGTDEAGPGSLGSLVGLQLWAGGAALVELDAWPHEHGRWRPSFHVDAP